MRNAAPEKELRLFVFATLLPVLLGTAATMFTVRTAWRKMMDDERSDLKTHAELVADALMGRVLAANLPGAPKRGNPNPSRHPPPPRHMKEKYRSRLAPEDVAPFCDDLRKTGYLSGTAFEIRNLDGSRFFATDDWPARHDLTGQCDLGPPLGDKTIVVASADGGANLRFRVRMMFTTAGIGSFFIISDGPSIFTLPRSMM